MNKTKEMTLDHAQSSAFGAALATFLLFIIITLLSNLIVAVIALVALFCAWSFGVFCVVVLMKRGDFDE